MLHDKVAHCQKAIGVPALGPIVLRDRITKLPTASAETNRAKLLIRWFLSVHAPMVRALSQWRIETARTHPHPTEEGDPSNYQLAYEALKSMCEVVEARPDFRSVALIVALP